MKKKVLLICIISTFIIFLTSTKSINVTKNAMHQKNIKYISNDNNKENDDVLSNEDKKIILEKNNTNISNNVVTTNKMVSTKPIKAIETTKTIITKPIKTSETTQKLTTSKVIIETKTNPVIEKSLKEQNQDLINDIKNIYGYQVSYNDEEFWFGGVSSTQLTDEEKANKALKDIKNKSAIFPKDFFKTFQGYNGFRIILFDKIEGASGVASYELGDDNFIAIDVNSGFLGRVFYHETFHIMEQYINYKTYGKTNPFDNWNNYNPEGFTYNFDESYKYTVYDYNDYYSYDNPNEISFVSIYAKSSPREDRAELFADMMFRAIKKDYMNNEYGVNKKAKELSLILREYFPNSIGAKWETFIDWS